VWSQRFVICVALVLVVASCGSSDSAGSSPTPTTPTTATTVSADSTVVVQNYTFPAVSTTAGATLTLVDNDAEQHTVTADDGSFKGGPFHKDAPATLVAPSKPGSYPFHCEIHPTMHGTLVVRD
jgi:plastocyanin